MSPLTQERLPEFKGEDWGPGRLFVPPNDMQDLQGIA